MRRGECVSDSSKKIKSTLDEEFDGFEKFGRKIDLTFYSGEYKLANCELKLPDAPEIDIKIQNRKKHTTGWNGSMFALFPYGDIYVSKYIQSVELPRTKAGLRGFLRGETLELLFKFVVRYRGD
ncbi:hypothetical protein BGZ54_001327 [Gamsiella multidivaricata]|nr:hypothetical protein BGZ54_001327 [Gamsiella multidivaricata]